MFDSWHSYPSTFALGHRALADLLDGPVLVEEKVDGSQFSFGVFDRGDEIGLELRCRSKGAQLNLLAPEKMFENAIATAQALFNQLRVGWTYRAEYLVKPKHNALAYDRVPAQHLILFDINPAHEEYLPWETKADEAARLGLEVVPRLLHGALADISVLREMLQRVSILGGQPIEGVVIKNYARFGLDKKVLIGKYVSEAFKEVHAAEWKAANPNAGDIVQELIGTYRTPARWQKALQHLREAGKIEDSPRDIGLLMREVPEDIAQEAMDEIKLKLWSWAWPKIRRGVGAGIAEWYKESILLPRQFQVDAAEGTHHTEPVQSSSTVAGQAPGVGAPPPDRPRGAF